MSALTADWRLLGGTFPDAARAHRAIDELVGDPTRGRDIVVTFYGKGETVLLVVDVQDQHAEGWVERILRENGGTFRGGFDAVAGLGTQRRRPRPASRSATDGQMRREMSL